ncbi:MAG: hypothetical protein U0Q18_08770 [Bryobacteraceae bacterium]
MPPIVTEECRPVPGGAELITYFAQPPAASGPSEPIPLLSVLKDTLGESRPDHDRLRQVWVYSSAHPSVWQRLASGVPFYYWKSVAGGVGGAPAPLLDLGAPAKGTWKKITASLLQSVALDPLGILCRASTRAYRGRAAEFREMRVWQALDTLSRASSAEGSGLTNSEKEFTQGRLLLSNKFLGGYVATSYAPVAWVRQRARLSEMRGHNWELLRQRAEENGLYFQPIEIGSEEPEFAMLWVERNPAAPWNGTFDSKFLNISDPHHDIGVTHWDGYTETWSFDADGARVNTPGEAVRTAVMVPLAVYSLEYPRVPLQLVDFRARNKAKSRELFSQAVDDIGVGLLGLTGPGNWPFLAARGSYEFVRRRHGAPTDRQERLRAYVELRRALLTSGSLDPELRSEISKRLERLDLNPLEGEPGREAAETRAQYATLVRRINDGGLVAELDRGRSDELRARLHSRAARAGFRILNGATLGVYHHVDQVTPALLAGVERQRRFQWNLAFLQRLLDAGTPPDVVASTTSVRASIGEVAQLALDNPVHREAASRVISQFLAASTDQQVRTACANCLQRLASADSQVALTPSNAGSD